MAAPRFFSASGCAGFTLIELVIVLVISVVLVYFTVRTLSPKQAQALEQAERLRGDVRHVQMLALTLNKSLQIKLSGTLPAACPAATYWVIDCTGAALDPCPAAAAATPAIVDPATGKNFCITFESGLTLGGSNLHFDPMGRPRSGAAFITSNATLTVNGGNPDRSVTIAPLTGFVTAQ